MKTNGLNKSNILSNVKPLVINSDQDVLREFTGNGWFIAYLFHKVIIGQFIYGAFDYFQKEKGDVQIENLIKLRIFNTNSELYVWRTNLGGFKGRLRTDGDGSPTDVVDANQVIFGTEAKSLDDNYVKITEKRGTEIILPLNKIGISCDQINDKDGRLCIHTRNYIGVIEETGQATYEDVRFVEFLKYQEDKS